jgi:hypothetical protein
MTNLTQLRWVARLFCIFTLAVSAPVFGQTVNLSLGSTSGQPGTSVSIPLAYAPNGAQASGLMWTFQYSASDLTDLAVTAGQAVTAAGKAIDCSSTGSGRYTCIASGMNANVIGNGTIATATFKLAPGTTVGSSSVEVLDSRASSTAGDSVTAAGSAGTITVLRTVALSGIGCNPSTLTAPASTVCTVSLSAAAGTSGFPVTLGYSASAASVSMPSGLTIPAGAASGTFTLQVNSATSATAVQVTATAEGVSRSTSISVSPQSAGDITPPVISSVASTPNATSAVVKWTTNEASDSRVEYGTSASSLTQVVADAARLTSHAINLPNLTAGVTYYYRIKSTDAAGNTATSPASGAHTFKTTSTPAEQYTVFPTTATPAILADRDTKSVELGMKFRSDVDGYVTGVRFYKGSSTNSGTHVGTLWTSSGQKLGSVTFTNETATGWQQATFTSPIPVKANTTYVISYFAPNGRYSATAKYFTSTAIHNPPLHVPAGAAGVYRYGSTSGFPTQTYNNSNYWVDVVFQPK